MTVLPAKNPATTVYLIDDDPNDVLIIRRVCESVGLNVQSFRSPRAFLNQLNEDAAGCIVVDLMMPEMTGLELHEQLRSANANLPVVVLTGQADAATCRTAFQNGVFDYVEKSFNTHDLLVVIRNAIAKNAEQLDEQTRRETFATKLSSLSPREREVMQLLADGLTLKEVGVQFGISVQTASKHRSKLFDKLEVSNEVELLKRLISVDPDQAGIGPVAA
jgi:two-component system response regulator FixJ